MEAGQRKETLLVSCPSTIKQFRGVVLTKASMSVVFGTAGVAYDAVTVSDATLRHDGTYTCEIIVASVLQGARFMDAGATIAQGDELAIVGTVGKFQPIGGNPASGLFATLGAVDGVTTSGFRDS